MKTKVARWGNSLALRIPSRLASSHRISEGTDIEIIEDEGEIRLRPMKTADFQLKDLLKKVTPRNRHGEISTSSPVGKESW